MIYPRNYTRYKLSSFFIAKEFAIEYVIYEVFKFYWFQELKMKLLGAIAHKPIDNIRVSLLG